MKILIYIHQPKAISTSFEFLHEVSISRFFIRLGV